MSDYSSTMPKKQQSGSAKTGQHILVIDDDPEIAESVRFALSEQGYRVSVASDGNQGVAIAETKFPDLLIVDMMMPRRSGFLVLERLRQTLDRLIPAIMITANEGVRHREYAELLGVGDYLAKPFTMDRLLASVHRLLVENVDD